MKLVVKVGGASDGDASVIAHDIVKLARANQVILVHGGSKDMRTLSASLGIEEQTLVAPDGMTTRYTTEDALDVLIMAMRGRTQTRLMRALFSVGLRPIGLSAADGGLVSATRKPAVRAVVEGRTVVVRDNLAGRISSVDAPLLDVLLKAGLTPVICPPAVSGDGELLNVDADRLAAAVAAHWGADQLLLLTAVDGVLSPEGEVVPRMIVGDRMELAPSVAGGMRMKLHAAYEALSQGVPRVVISNAENESPASAAVAGCGTEVSL